MTELYDQETPDSEDFLVAWLAPLMRSATERNTKDELPFALVTRIVGSDDPDTGSSEDTVQVDVLARGAQAASIAANNVHRRINLLARNQTPVTLSGGTVAAPDYVKTVRRPSREPYPDDKIVRYVARYRLGLSFIVVT